VQKHPEIPWNWGALSLNKLTIARECYMQKHLAQKAAKWFIKSDIKREMMEKMWHPKNLEKLQKHWGHDVFEE
jgi:hypothetical protein